MMDHIRETEYIQSLSPEERKTYKKKRYDNFSYINDSSDKKHIANVYKKYSENDENVKRKRKEFAVNDEKTTFMKEWCKNNNNDICVCPSDSKKYDQKEWNNKCDSSFTQDASLGDRYNYFLKCLFLKC